MFNINGIWWKVCFVEPDDAILLTNDNNYSLGVTIYEDKTIYISNRLYGYQKNHVLLHELFHAEMMSRNVFVPDYIEEALCDLVADYSVEIIEIAQKL